MRAAYYEKNGAVRDVLILGDVETPQPGPGEVRVKLRTSGVNPSDVKSREGRTRKIAFPRVIPHSDGAGDIDVVGDGVPASRVGERVWTWNGQWKRPFGTCAEYIVLPADLAVKLPAHIGYEAGAFTGASSKGMRGLLQQADGGTLFLDEIGELSPTLQVKLLRVIQERKFEPVGSTKTVHVDVRIIAATNKDLKNEMALKTFRDDLYHRLAVVTIQVPALKDRSEDIPELCNYFLQQQSSKNHSFYLDPAAEDYLVRQEWPGNVRELANAMERLSVFCDSEIRLKDLKTYL